MPRNRRQYLLAAMLAPAAGITVVAGLVILLFGPADRVMTGLFYLLLVGTPIAYGMEFLGIWYFTEHRSNVALPLRHLLTVAVMLGVLVPLVPIYGFGIVHPTLPWWLLLTLGAVGGVTSALVFRFFSPLHATE